MARAVSRILDSGEVLPAISMDAVAHGRISTRRPWANQHAGVLRKRLGGLPNLPRPLVTVLQAAVGCLRACAAQTPG